LTNININIYSNWFGFYPKIEIRGFTVKDKNNIFAVAAIILMVSAMGLGCVAIGKTYQYSWRLNFAQKHLDIAQGVTDAEAQYNEISKTIEILDTFPKQGNYLIYNPSYPTTNMQTSWSALYQLQNYSREISALDKSSSAYQLGIYNFQEKVTYFRTNLWEAFPTYWRWGAYGWLGETAEYLGIFGFLPSMMLLMVTHIRNKMPKSLLALLATTFILMIIFGAIIFYILNVPVYYTGPI